MKLNSKLAALANPRLLFALSLCVVGVLFALSSLTSFGRTGAESGRKSGMARKQNEKVRSRASKQTESSGGANARKPEQSTLGNDPAPRVTEQRNALGQTVYAVA